MTNGFLNDLRSKAIELKMHHVPVQMDSIFEAVLYGSALPAYAVEEIDLIWSEVEAEQEALAEPPTDEELRLHHPTFSVE
jgi:hypothetical protein